MENNANPCASLGAFSTLCSLTSDNFGFVVSTAITIILILATIIAVFYILYGGIRWILSRGDKEKVEDARNHVVAAVVGLMIAFLAFFIINIVVGFFFPGKSLKDLSLPTLGPDTKPPTVSIISPISDSTVQGTALIQTNATDNSQVTKVEFYVDGMLKNSDMKEPYEYSWNTKFYKHNSAHTISTKAYDSSGNIGTSASINVVVVDVTKPTVTVTNPINGRKVSSNTTLTIAALASDVSIITQVEFRINGVLKCTDIQIPYSCVWKIPKVQGVVYRIEASAFDTAGNMGSTSSSVTTI